MDQRKTFVMLMTASHRSVGHIVTAGHRLHDIINNKLSSCLTVYDVEVFRPQGPETPIAQFCEVTIPKGQINLILLQEQMHEAPTNRLYRYVQKNVYQTFLTVSGYEVQGRLHFTSLQKPELFLSDTSTSSIPISQATVTSVEDGLPAWQASAVFVRRASIASLHVGEQLYM
jgi:hypothetical protein